jgi:hypothetical protein
LLGNMQIGTDAMYSTPVSLRTERMSKRYDGLKRQRGEKSCAFSSSITRAKSRSPGSGEVGRSTSEAPNAGEKC